MIVFTKLDTICTESFTYGLISVMRPLLHQDSRESLGTSSRETSVFSFCHLTLDDSLSTSSRVIDEQTTGMAKRDAPRVPKKCQMREELYLKISRVERKNIFVMYLHFSSPHRKSFMNT